MTITYYSNGQRLAFAALFVAFVLCFVGAMVPFWVSGKITINDGASLFEPGFHIPFIGDTAIFSVEAGLFRTCYTAPGSTDCELHGYLRPHGSEPNIVRCAIVAVNLKLALLCCLAACCRCCCKKGGRTIFHGITSFIAGGAGIITVALFVNLNSGIAWDIVGRQLEWGFYLYAVGSGILIVASLLLCFLVPTMPVVQGGAPGGNTYVHLENEMSNVAGASSPPVQGYGYPPVQGYAHPIPAPENVLDTQPLI